MKRGLVMLLVIGCLWMVGGALAQPSDRFTLGDELRNVAFDSQDEWEFYEEASQGLFSGVEDGEYIVRIESEGFTFGADSTTHADTVLTFEARLTSRNDLGQYGGMCRLDTQTNDGYLFVVDGSNYYAIIRSDGGSPTRLRYGRVPNLDLNSTHQVQIVCVEDYLALYVDGELLVETLDATYRKGVIAMAISAPPTLGEEVEATFDNLILYAADSTPMTNEPLPALNGRGFNRGATLLTETFDSRDVWENFSQDSVDMRVEDGLYRATSSESTFLWAQNTAVHEDVVLDVNSTELTDGANGDYGVVCRADEANTGLGYYFLISSSGSYQIALSTPEAVLALSGGVIPDVILADGDTNQLEAVCIGDYLALYVNGTLLAEATDSTYREGVTGFVIRGNNGEMDVTFDDLRIVEARLTD
jgi:hypothetical protein